MATETGSTDKLLADVRVDLRLRARRAREVDVDLAVVDALGMLVELGAAGAAADRFDLRHLREQPLGQQAEPVRLGQRNAGIVLKREHQRALVERRQKAARQQCGGDTPATTTAIGNRRRSPVCDDRTPSRAARDLPA